MHRQFATHILNIKKILPACAKKKLYKYGKHLCAAFPEETPQWDISPDDVFLVSYPRSGNTWLRYLMTNLRFPEANWNLQSLAYAFPEIGSPIDSSYVPRPRWIKSHHSSTPSYPKVIYLLRDGRDVAVSFYHWSGYNEKCSFGEFVRNYILNAANSIGPVSAWHRHVEDWLANQYTSNMLVVQYEKLVEAPVTEIRRICEFVGLVRSVQDIEIAIERSSFEKQQADFRDYKPFARKRVGVKGGPGKWREFFDEELLAEFWRGAGEVMRSVGYE